MKSILIASMSYLSNDVRVMRHIRALCNEYRIETVGFGPTPFGSSHHLEIPKEMSYLPLNPTALFPHVLRIFSKSSRNTAAIRFVSDRLGDFRFDLALLNDVQTLPLMESINTPVIVDMHEYAPREMEDDYRFRIFLMKYYAWLCTRYLPTATRVLTVSSSLAQEFDRNFGLQTSVLLNAREFCDIAVRPSDGLPVRLVHTGLASRSRGLEVMIEAVADRPNFLLDMYLVPAPRQAGYFREIIERAEQTSNVRVCQPVPSDELPWLINQYDLSLIVFSPRNFSVRHSMPNKLFDSVQGRVGIVSGPSPDISSFCETFGVGVSLHTFSPIALRALLESLSNDEIINMKFASDRTAVVVNGETEAAHLMRIVTEQIRFRA